VSTARTGDGGTTGSSDSTSPAGVARERKHRLVAAVRRLAEAAQLLDADLVDATAVDDLVASMDETIERLDGHPSIRAYGTISGFPGWQSELGERSPISGETNPVAAPLRLRLDGDRIRGEATYGLVHEGPTGHAHGGIVAGAFDEVVGMAQKLSGSAGLTGTLTIRLRRPTPLHTPIHYEGGVTRMEGRKIFVWAHSYADGKLLAEAEAVMVTLRDTSGLIPEEAPGA
jgi:acyl-coenzyme A thioesterase PaaI-like protein